MRDGVVSSGGVPHRRLFLSHAGDEAFVPLTRVMFAKMGYSILPEEEWGDLPPSLVDRQPDLRIVDERRLGEVDPESQVPMILLTGRRGVTGADPRMIGAVQRPAGLHALYRLIQQALEDVPRSTPRVPTSLPACCRTKSREWPATVLSLSQNGCLLRNPEPLLLGSQLELSFELPGSGAMETKAEAAYQLGRDSGLVFFESRSALRHAIASFVEQNLTSI
jgi:hypothetical protein